MKVNLEKNDKKVKIINLEKVNLQNPKPKIKKANPKDLKFILLKKQKQREFIKIKNYNLNIKNFFKNSHLKRKYILY